MVFYFRHKQMRILDACCRWPGPAHDAVIFRQSNLHARFENGEFGNDSAILADSAYAQDYVCKPHPNPQTESEKAYQFAQVRSRNVVERTYGVLKRRFPCLSEGMSFQRDKIQDVILACCILHNFILDYEPNDTFMPVEEEEIERKSEIGDDLERVRQEGATTIQNFLINNFF